MVAQKIKHKNFKFWARAITYCLLAMAAADFFLFHPYKTRLEELPLPPANMSRLTENLRHHVAYLASAELLGRAPGTAGNVKAEAYLHQFFQKHGFPPAPSGRYLQEVADFIGNNVFAALPSTDPKNDWVILGAHFDHLGRVDGKDYLGADDNASSIAILLESARLMKSGGPMERFNLLFVGFNSEEPPHFLTKWMGSHQFFTRLGELGIPPDKVRLAVIMDLMGGVFWKPLDQFIFGLGAEKSPELQTLVDATQVPGLRVRRMGLHMIEHIPSFGPKPFSDYEVFRAHEVPHLFLSSGRTPDYHRPTDTMEKLYYPRMAATVHWLEKFFRKLDRSKGNLVYHPEREDYMQDLKAVTSLLQDAAGWTTKIPQTGLYTLYKLKRESKRVGEIKTRLENRETLSKEDIQTMRNASIRIQCLLGQMGPCFLIP